MRHVSVTEIQWLASGLSRMALSWLSMQLHRSLGVGYIAPEHVGRWSTLRPWRLAAVAAVAAVASSASKTTGYDFFFQMF